MEKVGIYNVQHQNITAESLQAEKVEKMPAELTEKPVEKSAEYQTGKDADNQLGRVIIKQIKQLPKTFDEVATAVELAAKDRYMDRRNVAQRMFGGNGKFVDVTV